MFFLLDWETTVILGKYFSSDIAVLPVIICNDKKLRIDVPSILVLTFYSPTRPKKFHFNKQKNIICVSISMRKRTKRTPFISLKPNSEKIKTYYLNSTHHMERIPYKINTKKETETASPRKLG